MSVQAVHPAVDDRLLHSSAVAPAVKHDVVPTGHPPEAEGTQPEAAERRIAEREPPPDEPARERADGRGAGQGAERELLGLRPPIEDPIHEHGRADDRGRERVAREQTEDDRRREGRLPELAQVEEGLGGRAAPPDAQGEGHERQAREGREAGRAPGQVGRARPGDRGQGRGEAHREERGTRPVDASPAARSVDADGPGVDEPEEAERHVQIKDPPPGRHEEPRGVGGRARGAEECLEMRELEHGGADERPGGHAQERQRGDEPERARPPSLPEEMARPGRRERDQGAAAEPLDETRDDELVEVLRPPRQGRPEREEGQREHEWASRPVAIARPAGQRHRRDESEEIPVDDPAGAAELRPVRDRRVPDDRRQGHGRDHELQARDEDPQAEERQEQAAGRESVAGGLGRHAATLSRPPALDNPSTILHIKDCL